MVIKTVTIVNKSAVVISVLLAAETNLSSLTKSAGKNSDTLILTTRLCEHFLWSSVNYATSASELENSWLVITDEQDGSEITFLQLVFLYSIDVEFVTLITSFTVDFKILQISSDAIFFFLRKKKCFKFFLYFSSVFVGHRGIVLYKYNLLTNGLWSSNFSKSYLNPLELLNSIPDFYS